MTYQQQDAQVVAELFRKHGAQLERHLTKILGSTALAKDVVQDTYEKLCTSDIRSVENLPGYLYQVARRFAYMRLRRSKIEAKHALLRIPLEDDPDRLAGPEARAMLDQSISHLKVQIALLSPALREVAVMRYLLGMEPSEIINRLGISESAYQQRITEGRNQLKQRLRAIGVDPKAL